MKNDKSKGKHSNGTSEERSESGESHEEQAPKRARARRLVLKSIVAGGAVTTATRTIPEKWTRPITDSVLMPVHANVSPGTEVSLACQVTSLSPGGDATPSPVIDPAGPWSGGSQVAVNPVTTVPIDPGVDDFIFELNAISVTLDPAAGGDVTLDVQTGGDMSLLTSPDSNASPNDNGVADFPFVAAELDRADGGSDESEGDLVLTFSAPGAEDCVMSFTFIEENFGPPPPPPSP